MAKRSGISKWQLKSNRVNKIRWELEAILNEDFTPEEKESQAYQELIESIETVYSHSLPGVKKEEKANSSWKTVLVISLAGSAGAILVKVAETLITGVSTLFTGGKP